MKIVREVIEGASYLLEAQRKRLIEELEKKLGESREIILEGSLKDTLKEMIEKAIEDVLRRLLRIEWRELSSKEKGEIEGIIEDILQETMPKLRLGQNREIRGLL